MRKGSCFLWGDEYRWIFSERGSQARLADRDRGRRRNELRHLYASVDTLIMGRNTYEQVLQLSPDEFPYEGKTCYIMSRTLQDSLEGTHIIREDVLSFVKN